MFHRALVKKGWRYKNCNISLRVSEHSRDDKLFVSGGLEISDDIYRHRDYVLEDRTLEWSLLVLSDTRRSIETSGQQARISFAFTQSFTISALMRYAHFSFVLYAYHPVFSGKSYRDW